MKKRLLSFAMALCMALSLLPAPVFAEENAETPVCTCEEACTAEDMDAGCAVCGAEGAAIENCCKYAEAIKEESAEAATQSEAAESEAAVCNCESSCTAEAMNTECPVCGAEGASVEDCCKYVAPEQDGSTEATTPPEAPVCSCEEACTVEAMDENCPVCGMDGAVPENCAAYVAPAAEEQIAEVVQLGAPAAEEPEPESDQTAVEKVQAMIDALPTVEELEKADDETVDAAYAAIQDVCDAMDELSTEELDQLTGLDKLAALMEWFTGLVSTYEGEDYSYLNYTEANEKITITGLKDEYKSMTEVTIPASIKGFTVTAIGDYAFRDCTNLTSITIPDSVTSIGKYIFYGCSSLTSITIPNGVTSIGNGTFQGCTGLTSITIPNGVTSIGVSAFQDCTKLTSITIPDSVTSINGSAFRGCTSLTSITIPNSVKSIDSYAFLGCSSLKSITIPNSVTSINRETFKDCTSLESITIPNGVKSIGVSAFEGCTSLTSITIPDSVTSIGVSAFKGCTSLTSITIPDSVTSIGAFTFYGCSSLTSITIPDSVTSINGSAFRGCTSLTSITIPNSVTSINGSAFEGCTSLTSITIPDSVTSIDGSAFEGCTSLTSITIPNSVTSIGESAFEGCTSLTSITIPKSVKSIRANACYGCSMLKDVYYLGTIEEWATITIGSDNNDLTYKVRCIGDITQGFSFTQPSNLTYDGKAKEATVTKTNEDYGDFTVKYYDQNGQLCSASPVDAGTYTVKIDIEASSKYSAISGYEVGQFTIQQAENSFTTPLSIEGWTYGDTPNAPTAEVQFGKPTYSYSTEEVGTYTTEQPTNAGTYWVKAVVEGTDSYTGLEAKKQFRILQKYTVTYAAGSNGSGTVAPGSKTQDVAFTLSSEKFIRAGYEQTGWSTSDGGEKVYELGGSYTANADITLYPVWSDITKPTGENDSTNHNLEKMPAKAATVTETGNIEYWQCQDCGDIFSDPDGKNEITLEDTVIAKLPPKIIEGTEQSVTAGEKKALSFRSNAAFSDFICVELDGKTLDEKNYTAKEGSTVVTLNAGYVSTLPAGEHTIGIVSESGTASTTFTVNAKASSTDSQQTGTSNTDSPQTGDNSPMALWIALFFVSGGLMTVMGIYGKKKKYNG